MKSHRQVLPWAKILSTGSIREKTTDGAEGPPLSEYFRTAERPRFEIATKRSKLSYRLDTDAQPRFDPGSGKGSLTVVTNVKLIFFAKKDPENVTSESAVLEVPYLEVRNIEVKSGLLKTRIEVTTRRDEVISFSPGDTDAQELEDYIATAIRRWRRIRQNLNAASEQSEQIRKYIESGEPEAAKDAYREALEHVETATQAADDLGEDTTTVIETQIERTERLLESSRVQGHRTRAEQHLDSAARYIDRQQYAEAYESYLSALQQRHKALAIAENSGVEVNGRLDDEIGEVQGLASELKRDVLDAAERARERAMAADTPGAAVSNWQEALTQYRSLLELGWGTDLGRDPVDTDALRMQIEWVVQNLKDARRSVATKQEKQGDRLALGRPDDDDVFQIIEHYESALAHLQRVEALSKEYRSGDPSKSLSVWMSHVEQKIDHWRD
jgi:tetratricopeptide (TPR) repeat protein